MPTMRADAPRVSVLMAVYNTPHHYLGQAISSILAQTCADFEFIIIDDGSNEETSCILCEYASKDPRVHLSTLPANIGLTSALNIGLSMASGSYIARQDADDISEPNRLSAQLEFLAHHPEVDAVGTNAILIDFGGNKIGEIEIDPELKGLSRRNMLVHGSMFFRRQTFAELGGYDERMKLSQDYELYLRMQRKHGMRIGILPESHYRLRQHSASLSSRRMFRQLYYSVMAKRLNEKHKSRFWPNLLFCRDLAVDFFFTHRFFLGIIMRSLIGFVSRTYRKASPK